MAIYFDNASSTYTYPEVIKEVSRMLEYYYYNPNNLHSGGILVRTKVEEARNKIASLIGADPKEIIFVGSASEGNAIAINSCDKCYCESIVHHDIIENPKTTIINNIFWDKLDHLEEDDEPVGCLWATSLVNNETGEIYNIEDKIVKAHNHGMKVLLDCTQALGNIPINANKIDADFMTFSTHKQHGIKGCSFMYVKEDVEVVPIIYGTQEKHRRGSTECTEGIVGTAIAVEKSIQEMDDKNSHCEKLRKAIIEKLYGDGIDFIVNEGDNNIPSILNIALKHISGEVIMSMLSDKEIYTSNGSACDSGDLAPSRTLLAMGVSDDYIQGNLRISMSLRNTEEEANILAQEIVECYRKLVDDEESEEI